MIKLISHFSGEEVLWVDDRVELTGEEIRKITSTVGTTREVELDPLDATWAYAVLNDKVRLLTSESLKEFARAGRKMMSVCEASNFNLALVNFKEAAAYASRRQSPLFLFDLRNDTKALGCASYDKTWRDWSFYGAKFVKHFGIAKDRFRFVSRYRVPAGNPVKEILPRYFREDNDVWKHSLSLEDLAALERNFIEFLECNSWHADPSLNAAIVFAAHNEKPWEHNSLARDGQNAEVAGWLGARALDAESAKALFLGGKKGDWQVSGSTNGCAITAIILKRTCEKLGFTLDTERGVAKYRLPTQPSLPFLMSIAALLWDMRQCTTTYPPDKIAITRAAGNHILRFELKNADRAGQPIHLDKVMEMLKIARKTPNSARHITSARLANLERAVVAFKPKPPRKGSRPAPKVSAIVAPFFNGASEDVVKISIDKSSPAIVVTWKTQNI